MKAATTGYTSTIATSAKIILIISTAALLGACAHNQAGQQEPQLKDKYIHAVEREGQKRAVTVYWVNPPSNQQVANMTGAKQN